MNMNAHAEADWNWNPLGGTFGGEWVLAVRRLCLAGLALHLPFRLLAYPSFSLRVRMNLLILTLSAIRCVERNTRYE